MQGEDAIGNRQTVARRQGKNKLRERKQKFRKVQGTSFEKYQGFSGKACKKYNAARFRSQQTLYTISAEYAAKAALTMLGTDSPSPCHEKGRRPTETLTFPPYEAGVTSPGVALSQGEYEQLLTSQGLPLSTSSHLSIQRWQSH